MCYTDVQALEHVFPTVVSTRDDECIKKIGIPEDLTVDVDGDAGSTSSAVAAAVSVGLVSMSVHLVWQGRRWAAYTESSKHCRRSLVNDIMCMGWYGMGLTRSIDANHPCSWTSSLSGPSPLANLRRSTPKAPLRERLHRALSHRYMVL